MTDRLKLAARTIALVYPLLLHPATRQAPCLCFHHRSSLVQARHKHRRTRRDDFMTTRVRRQPMLQHAPRTQTSTVTQYNLGPHDTSLVRPHTRSHNRCSYSTLAPCRSLRLQRNFLQQQCANATWYFVRRLLHSGLTIYVLSRYPPTCHHL